VSVFVCVCVRVFAETPSESKCFCQYAQVREQLQQLQCEKSEKKEKERKRCGSECEAISDQEMRRAWWCVFASRAWVEEFVCVCVCVCLL